MNTEAPEQQRFLNDVDKRVGKLAAQVAADTPFDEQMVRREAESRRNPAGQGDGI